MPCVQFVQIDEQEIGSLCKPVDKKADLKPNNLKVLNMKELGVDHEVPIKLENPTKTANDAIQQEEATNIRNQRTDDYSQGNIPLNELTDDRVKYSSSPIYTIDHEISSSVMQKDVNIRTKTPFSLD